MAGNQKHRQLKSTCVASGGSLSSIPSLPLPRNGVGRSESFKGDMPSLGGDGRRESTGGIFNTPNDRSPRGQNPGQASSVVVSAKLAGQVQVSTRYVLS